MDSISQNPYRLEEYLDTLDETQRKEVLAQKLKEWHKPKDWTLWELKLEHAFSLVLGKPLSEFDPEKEYHIYYEYDVDAHSLNMDELMLEVNEKAIKERFKKICTASHAYDDIFDKSKSYYGINPEWAREAKVKHIFDESMCYVLGKDLAKIIDDGLVDIEELEQAYCNEKDIEGLNKVIVYRCLSGVSLFEAMYAIFFIVGAEWDERDENGMIYKHTMDDEMEFDIKWVEILKTIEDERLKDHLLVYFTAPSGSVKGWDHKDIKDCFLKSLISLLGGRILANWYDTYDEQVGFSLWEMDKHISKQHIPVPSYVPK